MALSPRPTALGLRLDLAARGARVKWCRWPSRGGSRRWVWQLICFSLGRGREGCGCGSGVGPATAAVTVCGDACFRASRVGSRGTCDKLSRVNPRGDSPVTNCHGLAGGGPGPRAAGNRSKPPSHPPRRVSPPLLPALACPRAPAADGTRTTCPWQHISRTAVRPQTWAGGTVRCAAIWLR